MQANSWTRYHDIGLIYLACMHGTDDDIDPAEYILVKELLQKRVADEALNSNKVFEEVMLMYVSQSVSEMVNSSIASLSDGMSQEELAVILKDLADIAAADGLVYPEEIQFIADVAREWGLEEYISGNRNNIS